jgi:hypothetical protein
VVGGSASAKKVSNVAMYLDFFVKAKLQFKSVTNLEDGYLDFFLETYGKKYEWRRVDSNQISYDSGEVLEEEEMSPWKFSGDHLNEQVCVRLRDGGGGLH